ncbi:MAG: hypothetical protein J1E98_00915 [Lachnospiraceae bacterium]|nr:hypothetical protein [Lachnospiraceae bacterium]
MQKKIECIKELARNKKLFSLVVILFFVVYLIIGLFIFRDYGVSADELVQRDHSRIAYKYINEKLFHREVDALSGLQDLPEYENKYYGVAMQIPLVVIEDVFHFQLSLRHIVLIRHLYNFLVCYAGYICFYFFLKKVFMNRWFALSGTALISLYPRFFANQFYDIKNIIFVALNMITLLMLVRVVEKCNFLNILIFAFSAALATNQRIMGIMFPVVLIGYFIIIDIMKIYTVNKEKNPFVLRDFVSILKKYILIIVLYMLSWFAITPTAWEQPLQTFYATFVKFSHYDTWNGTMIFNGRFITCEERPWYYLFVWFGISIPLLYLILFMLGHVYAVVSIYRSQDKWNDIIGKHKWLLCTLVLFWGSVGAVIFMNARIYGEWRHMFFVFVPFCCIAIYGLKWLLQVMDKKIVFGVIAICLLVQLIWLVKNHPYQFAYYNTVGKPLASGFDKDSWRLCNTEMLFWILANDDDDQISIELNASNGFIGVSQALLSEDEKRRLHFTRENPDYILDNYVTVIGNTIEYDGYEECYTIWVDDCKIASIFRKE